LKKIENIPIIGEEFIPDGCIYFSYFNSKYKLMSIDGNRMMFIDLKKYAKIKNSVFLLFMTELSIINETKNTQFK
jgi:hypothetical protein